MWNGEHLPSPTKSNNAGLSDADVERINAGRKRKLESYAKPEPEERLNYPVDTVCTQKCKSLECQDLCLDARRHVYRHYNSMSPDEQNLFMACTMCIKRVDREESWTYIIPFGGRHFNVCRTTYITVLDISTGRASRIQERIEAHEIMPRNMRGRSENPHKINEAVKEVAIMHMHTYPKHDNHYCRETIREDMQFLASSLTITDMYKDFCSNVGENLLSETSYRLLFHHPDTKLRIGVPHADCCESCDLFAMNLKLCKTEETRQEILRAQKQHHDHAQETVNQYKKDKELARTNPTKYVTLTGDCQKNWVLPGLSNQSAYFKRKFIANNFGIHDSSNNNGFMYVWDETIAKKGSSDIASIWYKHITENYEPLEINCEKHLVIWADRCVAQNNNHAMIVLAQQLIRLRYFTSCTLKFFISGHSYNDSDGDFAPIERKHRKNPVKTPLGMKKVIESARPSQPFICTQLLQSDFYNFLPLQKYFKKPPTLHVTTFLYFEVHQDDINNISCKTFHTDTEVQVFRVLLRGKLISMEHCPLITSAHSYTGPLPLKNKKKNDLIDLMKFLDPIDRKFYLPHVMGKSTNLKLKKLFPDEIAVNAYCEDEEYCESSSDDDE